MNRSIKSKKVVSISEHKSMMDMLKQLYGNDEVKDDNTNVRNNNGDCRTSDKQILEESKNIK